MTGYFEIYGLTILFFLMLTNGFISVPPSELTLMTAGAVLVNTLNYDFSTVIGVALIGNIVGASILYLIGYLFGIEKIMNAISIITKKILPKFQLKNDQIINGFKSIILENPITFLMFFRALPVVRSIVSLPAGAVRVNFFKFLILSCFGMFVWCAGWIYLGATLFDLYQNSLIYKLSTLLFGIGLAYFFVHLNVKKYLKKIH